MNDHNSIYSIVEKLRVLEESLDKNQKSVNQLSATFKPKTVAVLTAKTDPKNPMAGKLVGGCEESEETEEESLEEAVANEEKLLDKVKKSLTDYLSNIEQKYKDDSISKKAADRELGTKDKIDRDLIAKALDEDPTEEEEDDEDYFDPSNPTHFDMDDEDDGDLPSDRAYARGESPYDAPEPQVESAPVKTVTNECGIWEMHGNEHDGFEIRRGGRSLPSRFKNLDEAEMAVEMFLARRRMADDTADYLEEK